MSSRENGLLEYTILKPRTYDSLLVQQNQPQIPNSVSYGIGYFSLAEGKALNLDYVPGSQLHLPDFVSVKPTSDYVFSATDKGRCKIFSIKKKHVIDHSVDIPPPTLMRTYDRPICAFQIDGLFTYL